MTLNNFNLRYIKLIVVFLISQLLLSCNNDHSSPISKVDNDTTAVPKTFKKISIDPDHLLKDFNTWYGYTYYNVLLSHDFIGLDIDSANIDKPTFLHQLIKGNTVAFKIGLLHDQPVYKLYTLNSSDKSIRSTIIQMAAIENKNFEMEGKPIPAFNFTDINGNHYNNAVTKGKILVLKCWFINCVACVKEFPQCNELVKKYKDNKDVLFISLASDSKQDLSRFLKKNPLNYAVIPLSDNYMNDKLRINLYPTHLLIDKTGKIVKVVNSIEELEPFLKKEVEE